MSTQTIAHSLTHILSFLYSYLARPFNFSLFPHTFRTIDKRFVCQASALQFLAQNNFDFNKFVYKGMNPFPFSFLPPSDFRRLIIN